MGLDAMELITIPLGYSHIFRYELPEARSRICAASSTSYLWALVYCEYVVLVDPNLYCPQQYNQGIQP